MKQTKFYYLLHRHDSPITNTGAMYAYDYGLGNDGYLSPERFGQYIELLIVITRTMCIYLLNTDKFAHSNMNPFLLTIRSGVSIIKNKKKAG